MTISLTDVEWARAMPVGLARYVMRERWEMTRHLWLVNDRLMKVAAGRLKRLLIVLPPRSGKSTIVDEFFVPWYLGRFPDRKVILVSYGGGYAASWGRKARDVMEEHGPTIFGVSVSQSSAASEWWEIEGHAGALTTAGAGGAITGKGGNVLIVDDATKSDAGIRSLLARDRLWEWYTSVVYTRLEDQDSAVVMICTRWHEDDLAGRVLAQMQNGGEQWEILRLPAMAEEDDLLGRAPGEALWPLRFPVSRLEEIKATLGSYYWAALYQGRPAPAGGGMFRREWFAILDARPTEMKRTIRYWDLAATEARPGADPDYTSGTLMGVGQDGQFYILDVQHTRASPFGVQQLILQTAALDGKSVPVYVEQEPGASGKMVVDTLVRALAGYNAHGQLPSGDKATRAAPLSAQAEAGNVKIVRGPWTPAFLDELMMFPHGAHDDMVDSTSGAFNKLTSGGGFNIWT